MTYRTMLHRRTLIGIAAGGVTAWLGMRGASLGGHRQSEYAALAALCTALNCPEEVCTACRAALLQTQRSAAALVRELTADLRIASGGRSPKRDLAQAARRQSREDFLAGRVVAVDGWMLSLTEVRLYALAGLLPPDQAETGWANF